MIEVREIKFTKEFKRGDGLVVLIDNQISIFYAEGIILNDKYLVGKKRFVKNSNGNRKLSSLEQHQNIPEKIYGNYSFHRKKPSSNLNGINISTDVININNVLCILKGENTFRYNSKRYGFAKKLLLNFPEIDFSEIGSSNVGLSSSSSDIDIYVPTNYERVVNSIRRNPAQFELSINPHIFAENLTKHHHQYVFSLEESEKICRRKLSGLEFKRIKTSFFDAKPNPLLLNIFNPNCDEKIKTTGVVKEDSFAGHGLPFYDIENIDKYSIALVRGIFKKEKSYVLKKGDSVELEGRLIHRNPNIVIAKSLNLMK